MSEDLKQFWNHLDTLPRKEVLRMAEDELLDVRGLSIVKQILHKYNLSSVTLDHKLRFTLKRSLTQNPRKDLKEKEQGKD